MFKRNLNEVSESYDPYEQAEKDARNAKGSRYIVYPIILAFLLLVMLFFKSRTAAFNYLYCLIPLLVGTAFFGTKIYNKDGDMKLFCASAMLTEIGCALQLLIDQVYNPLTTFSIIKLVIACLIGYLFVYFYRVFRLILNKSFTVYLMMTVCAVIYAVLLVAGKDPNGYGTSAWIRVGGITIQLTDFTKVAAMLFYSALFSSSTRLDDNHILILSSIFFGINLIGSILIHELGSMFILYFLHLSILFIFMKRGKAKRIYLLSVLILTVLVLGICFILWRVLLPGYQAGTLSGLSRSIWVIVKKIHDRFSVAANIYSDPNGAGYQLMQGKRALWMAGLFGNTVNFHTIPVAESDMAFIALVNAFGFIAGFFVIFLFLRIMISGSELSRRLLKEDVQDSVVVYGATVLIFLQAMIVILGSCNVIPFAGLPIPLLSRGFTYETLVFCFLGLLLHMSEQNGDMMLKGDADEENGQSERVITTPYQDR